MPRKWLAVGGVVAVILAVGAALLARGLVTSNGSSKEKKSSSPRRPPGFVEFRGPGSGLSIAYPAGWSRLQSRDPQVQLLVAGRGGASAQLRVVPFRFQDLASAKRVSDRIVRSGKGVRVLAQPRQARLGGLPGFLYIYAFRDAPTGQRGAHAHYFLFRRNRMITLVFQALPATRFGRFAPLFDRIAGTFRA